MINIRTLKRLKNNEGLTLKNGKPVTFKTGYQVATEGKETPDMKIAMNFVKEYGGNCGIWFSNGIWYIDKSHRETRKRDALRIGKENNQISILKWSDMSLIYC